MKSRRNLSAVRSREEARGLVRLAQAIAALDRWPRRLLAFAAGAISSLAMAPAFLWPVLFLTWPVLVWLIDRETALRGVLEQGAGQESGPDAAREARPGAARKAGPDAGAGTAQEAGRDGSSGRFRGHFLRHKAAQLKGSALIGWWFGFAYFLAGLYWVGAAFLVEADKFAWLMPFAVLLMPAGLALFWALAAALAAFLWRPGPARVIALALAFMVLEWARGVVLTGFPWNNIGYALTADPALMQLAALFGTYGLAFWSVALFAAPAVLGDPAAFGARGHPFLLAVMVLLALAYGFGQLRLMNRAKAGVPDARLRLVQPAIDQKAKWRPENRRAVFERLIAVSRQRPDGGQDALESITHLIWPESAPPFLLLRSPEARKALAELLPAGTTLLLGAMRMSEESAAQGAPPKRRYYNSIMALDSNAELIALYDKSHLVPFGEYVPLRGLLERMGLEPLTRMRGGFTAGDGLKTLTVAGLPPLSPLICYEAIFPGEVARRDVRPRPKWLLNLTNDAWFGESAGPYQHLHQARVRAVEEGLPLVRVANTGVSAVIDPYGRTIAHLGLNVRGTIDARLPKALATPPPFARLGNWITLAVLLFGGGLYVWLCYQPQRTNRHTEA